MHRVVRASLFVAFIGVINLGLSIAIPASANVVTDWNNAALDSIRADRTAPPIASRSLAIAHVAIYDAVNGLARTHEPYLVPSAVPASASRPAAASAAAHQTLVSLFPSHTSTFDALHAAILATIPTTARTKRQASCGANSSPAKSSRRGRMMVPMRSFSHPAAVVPAYGFPRLRRIFLICCRNGDSSRRLQ